MSQSCESNCGQWSFDHVKRETRVIANDIDMLSLSACKCHLYDLSGLLLVRSGFWMEVCIDNVIFWLLSCNNNSHMTLFSLINTMPVITLLSKLWRLVWGFLPIFLMISTLSTLFAGLWELILLLSDCPTFMSLSDCMILSSNGQEFTPILHSAVLAFLFLYFARRQRARVHEVIPEHENTQRYVLLPRFNIRKLAHSLLEPVLQQTAILQDIKTLAALPIMSRQMTQTRWAIARLIG